jgi:hypothetical protein
VARELSSSERVAAWDVPEKLGKLIGSDEGRMDLMSDPFTPLKIRQAVLEEVRTVWDHLTESPVKVRASAQQEQTQVIPNSNPDELKSRGPRLALLKVKDERAIFQDKSEVPRNVLLWPLTEKEEAEAILVKAGTEVNPKESADGISKVTKDDKVPIQMEPWDKFLYLGLSEKIKTRGKGWAEAARTIRPLVARFWRRLQLRKWIQFVQSKKARLEAVTDQDRDAARDCSIRLQAATFWEWKAGSRPMFWNYPHDQQLTMRDGIIL